MKQPRTPNLLNKKPRKKLKILQTDIKITEYQGQFHEEMRTSMKKYGHLIYYKAMK